MSEPYIPTRILFEEEAPKRRVGVFLFSVAAYATFHGVFLYLLGFLTNFGVPKAIDDGQVGDVGLALAVDAALLVAFGLQHSVMARPAFKRRFLKLVPESAERSAYVLATNLVLGALFVLWRPLPTSLWRIESDAAAVAVHVLFAGGVGLVLYSTFLIDHFDLFGLRQGWYALVGKAREERPFKVPGLYRAVRHPLYVGWFVVLWATPNMTLGRLLFAAVTSAYILVAIVFEERDLVRRFGREYVAYQQSTPRLVPRLRRAERARRGLAAERVSA